MPTRTWVKVYYDLLAREDLSWDAKLVYSVLLDQSRGAVTVSVGVRRLASLLAGHKSHVQRIVRELVDRGLIVTVERKNGLRSTYRIVQDGVPKTGTVETGKPYLKQVRHRTQNRYGTVPKIGTRPDYQTTDYPPKSPQRGDLPPSVPSTEPPSASAGLFEDEPPPPKRRPRREPDPIWDTICEVFGLRPQTKRELARVGSIVADLKIKHATTDEIRRRLANLRTWLGDQACTPEALRKNWDVMSNGKAPLSRIPPRMGIAPKPGKYDGI